MTRLPHGTVTLVFTDIEGSTDVLRRLGRARYVEALSRHRDILRDAFTRRGGIEVDTQGDSTFFAFPSARNAVFAAADAQRALLAHEWADEPVRVRMGMHVGEPEVADDDSYAGLDVHRAARVMSAAHGGQVLLTARTTDLVEGELGEDLGVLPLGAYLLKDFDRPEPLAQLVGDGLPREFPPVRATPATAEAAPPATAGRRWISGRRLGIVLGGVVALAGAVAAATLSLGGTAAGPTSNVVVGIDPAHNRVTTRAQVGDTPSNIAAGAGGVWVVNARDGTISELSQQGRALRTIGTTGVPIDVATTAGAVWVAARPNVILRLDPETGAVMNRITLRAPPTTFGDFMWLAARGGSLFVSAQSRLARIDGRANPVTLTPWPSPDWGPIAVASDAVWESSNSTLYKLDAAGKRVEASLSFPQGPLALGGGYLWAVNPTASVVAQIDPATAGIVRTIPVGQNPAGVAVGEGSVWVASQDGTVTRIEPQSGRVMATIELGGSPQHVAIGFGRVWVSIA